MPQTVTYGTIARKFLLWLCLVPLAATTHAQIISSIGGSGVAGFSDDGAATEAQLYAPQGVAVSGGTIYVADGRNNRIRKIMARGVMSTIAGNDDPGNRGDNGPATDAQLNGPAGVATDRAGNIYIADKYNNRIRKIGINGTITAFAGTGVQGLAGDGGQATAAQLNAPTGIVADTAGNIYIADAGNNCVRKVAANGIMSTIAGNGSAGFAGDGHDATAALLNTPTGVAVDTAGNVYIADSWNYRIRKITPAGIITTMAGTGAAGFDGDGEADTSAILNLPTGLVLDKAGNLYIADQANNRIRKITPDGTITTIAGMGTPGFRGDGGNAMAGEMNAPYGITIDAAGNLFVAEQDNNRIRKITPPPPPPKLVKNATKRKAPPAREMQPIPNPPMWTPPPPVNRGFQYSPGAAASRRHRGG